MGLLVYNGLHCLAPDCVSGSYMPIHFTPQTVSFVSGSSWQTRFQQWDLDSLMSIAVVGPSVWISVLPDKTALDWSLIVGWCIHSFIWKIYKANQEIYSEARAWPMLHFADCSDGRLSRLWEQPMLRPMLSVTHCLQNKPNVTIWLWTQLH